MNKILIGLILAVTPMAFAQDEVASEGAPPAEESEIIEHGYSLTPFIGFAFGGGVEINDTQLTEGFKSVKITPGDNYGLRFDVRLEKWARTHVEFSVGQQRTQLEDKARLFAQEPAGPFPPDAIDTLDMRVTHGHASLLWDLSSTTPTDREAGTLQPFLLAGVGLTHFSATAPITSQVAPSVVGGGGTRLWLSRNTALRFEARGYLIGTQEKASTVPITNRDCEGTCLRTYRYPTGQVQLELNVGFTWGYDRLPYVDKMFRRGEKSDD